MKNFHKFLINCSVFFFAFICIFLLAFSLFFVTISPQYLSGYDAAILDKRSVLLSINDPKIILCGNSNVAYGIQSSILEEKMGMPVVNLGLHGSLGDRFIEELAKENIRRYCCFTV